MDAEDGLPMPRRIWAVAAILLAITMAVLDGAIANVALPTIARDVHADPASAIWVVNAYQLAIVVSLLPFASLGEIVGYRRVFRGGVIVFTLASGACALSHTLVELTAARIVQGIGAAAIMSLTTALIRHSYPQRMLGRAIGINALIISIAAATGPSIAAGILAVANWPWLFAVNLPIGVLAVIASVGLPRTDGSGRKFDWLSAAINALAFGLLIAGRRCDRPRGRHRRALDRRRGRHDLCPGGARVAKTRAHGPYRPLEDQADRLCGRGFGLFFHGSDAGLCHRAVLL